jgi:hypothetical protein
VHQGRRGEPRPLRRSDGPRKHEVDEQGIGRSAVELGEDVLRESEYRRGARELERHQGRTKAAVPRRSSGDWDTVRNALIGRESAAHGFEPKAQRGRPDDSNGMVTLDQRRRNVSAPVPGRD